MEKANFETLEQKLKRIAEENGFDSTPEETEPIFINLYGKQVEVVHFDGETLETSIWVTVKNEMGITSCFKTKYAKAQEILHNLKKSGLGKQLQKYTFDNYKTELPFQEDIKQTALEFVNDGFGWFAILGQSGVGKSHICTAIAAELAKKGLTLKYMLWLEEINKVKYNMKEQHDKWLKECTDADVLYIDDFLKTRKRTDPTDTDLELAFEVLDARYREGKITIISSEKYDTEIEKYDRAVYRRILEMAGENNVIVIPEDTNKDMSLKYKDGEK